MNQKRILAATARAVAAMGFVLGIGVAQYPLVSAATVSAHRLAKLRGLSEDRIDASAPKQGATVLLFYSSECPISNAYSPTLTELIGTFRGKPVKWVGVCVDPDLADAQVKTHAKDFNLKMPITRDRTGSLARDFGAKLTPEVFVIDDADKVRYHGRIDDQFAARRVRNAAPNGTELKDALNAILSGKEVKTAHVDAVGCPIPEARVPSAEPTYSKDVAVILQKNCVDCHRPGQVGPFALETYEQVRKRASDIAMVVEDRSMPPWKAMPHFGMPFKDERSLSQRDIDTISSWAENGAPEGNPADLPAPRKYSDDWKLGTPDMVIDIGADFAVPASGDDIYRCFVIPASVAKDQYISGIEYRPGNRKVVHHILGFVDVSGKAREKDKAEAGPGYTCFSGPGLAVHGDLGGWAPGVEGSFLPDGIGRQLPKGSDVIVQVHYHPSGKPETDRTQIGLYFARKPVKQIFHWTAAAANLGLELPPGQSNIEIKADWEVPLDLTAHAVAPHMHMLGHDMTMTVRYPDGHTQDLIKIADWDFNWQYQYQFQKPLDLPKGSVVSVVAHFDNSESNPRNPSKPPKLVTWGEATTEEMCIGFIAVTKKGQDLTRPGETDDLMMVFQKQREERFAKAKAMREKRLGKKPGA